MITTISRFLTIYNDLLSRLRKYKSSGKVTYTYKNKGHLMNKEIIGKAKLLKVSLEPGMVIDEEISEVAIKTIEELINIARKENGENVIKMYS